MRRRGQRAARSTSVVTLSGGSLTSGRPPASVRRGTGRKLASTRLDKRENGYNAPMIVLVGALVWLALCIVALALCVVAKRADLGILREQATAGRAATLPFGKGPARHLRAC